MNDRARLITLLTDFGTADWFVGTMKGVIWKLNPQALVVDLTHEIPPGDIRAGAFALAAAARYFPRGTIHLAVVDPGVGTKRAALAVQTADYLFVGPDNGVLSPALAREHVRRIHRLENVRYFLPAISRTFHGRDVFAPVAAHLSAGLSCAKLGPKLAQFHRLPETPVRRRGSTFVGTIVYVDRFGNAISNLPNELAAASGSGWMIRRGTRALCPVAAAYQAVPSGWPVAVPGSTGFLEIAINGGHAARTLKLARGATVILERRRR